MSDDKKEDVMVNLPAEYVDALQEVISVGLKRAHINPLVRKELQAWWSAERELMLDRQ